MSLTASSNLHASLLGRSDPLILDGPTGTELISRGYTPRGLLWTGLAAADAPALLKAIHADYVLAGAEILTANTFRTSAYACAKAGLSADTAKKLTFRSVALAREAVAEAAPGAGTGARGAEVFVAGSLAPLEDCYQPQLVPDDRTLAREHAKTAAWLKQAGADLILVETMGTEREARAATQAAIRSGIPFVAVSFITEESGRLLLGGDDLVAAARACLGAGAGAVLVNCVHTDTVDLALKALQPLRKEGKILGAYANAGRMTRGPGGAPVWRGDTRPVEKQAEDYAAKAYEWVRWYGARIVGSCCGTTPEHIRQVAQSLRRKTR